MAKDGSIGPHRKARAINCSIFPPNVWTRMLQNLEFNPDGMQRIPMGGPSSKVYIYIGI